MFCIHCGRPLPQEDSYCVCGGLQPGQKPRAEATPVAPSEPQRVVPPVEPEPVAPSEPPRVVPPVEPEPAAPSEPRVEAEPAARPEPVHAEASRPVPPMQSPVGYPQANAYAPQNAYPQQGPYPQQQAYPPQNPYPQQHVYAQPYPYPQQPMQGQYPHNPYAPPVSTPYAPAAQPVQPSPAVHSALKALAGSPLFLIGTIFVSLGFVLSVISCFLPTDLLRVFSMLPGELSYVVDLSEIQYELYAYQSGSALATFFMALPGLILSALTVAGLWITFASGKSRKSASLKTSGLTILKVLQIIGMIGYAILALLFVVFLVIALVASAAAGSTGGYAAEAASAVLLVVSLLLLVFLAFIVVMIVYCAKVIGSLSAVKTAAQTGAFSKKPRCSSPY